LPDNVWTSHSRSELNNDQLTWKITSHIPDQQNEPLTIKDTLPKGLTYENATIKANDKTLTLQPTQEGNTIAWTIEPKHAGKTITITLTAKLDPTNIEWHTPDDQPKMRRVHFENNATIYQNDTPIKTVTQTQSVLESTVKNPITKTDPTKPTQKSTTHKYNELANEQKSNPIKQTFYRSRIHSHKDCDSKKPKTIVERKSTLQYKDKRSKST